MVKISGQLLHARTSLKTRPELQVDRFHAHTLTVNNLYCNHTKQNEALMGTTDEVNLGSTQSVIIFTCFVILLM